MKRLIAISLIAALAAACSQGTDPVAENAAGNAAVVATGYTMIDLGTLPGGAQSGAADINDYGVVVGSSDDAGGRSRAFRWTAAEGMKDLGTLPGGTRSSALRILNSGKILGMSETAEGEWVEVIWSPTGRIERLNIPRLPPSPLNPDGFWSISDFNERGEFVGTQFDGDLMHGWFWSKATGLVDLRQPTMGCMEQAAYAINASGYVTGMFCNLASHPFIWKLGGEFRDLGVGVDELNISAGFGFAINDARYVAGAIDYDDSGQPNAVIWTPFGLRINLPNLPARYHWSYAWGLNKNMVAVGNSLDEATDTDQPVVWPNQTTIVRLLGQQSGSGSAAAVNSHGAVVGTANVGAGPMHARLWRPGGNGEESVQSPPSIRGAAPAVSGRLRNCLRTVTTRPQRESVIECVLQH